MTTLQTSNLLENFVGNTIVITYLKNGNFLEYLVFVEKVNLTMGIIQTKKVTETGFLLRNFLISNIYAITTMNSKIQLKKEELF